RALLAVCSLFGEVSIVSLVICYVRSHVLLSFPTRRSSDLRFACFNSRPRQNNTVHFPGLECLNRFSHSQVGFTGSCRSNTKYHRIVIAGITINLLTLSFRADSFARLRGKSFSSSTRFLTVLL